MEHIKLFDWCSSESDVYFVNEKELDNCVTERILRNKFYDPLISSEEETEHKQKIDWKQVFKTKEYDRLPRLHVAGMRPPPPYPKLSAISAQHQYQCLKVLCAQNPHILDTEFMPRPTKQDYKIFEEVKVQYAKEQQEYMEWAKTLWTNVHCIRALRPKPDIEEVYEAEFKMKAHEMQSYPKNFELAAQIPLESRNAKCDMVHQQDLINVDVTTLPTIKCPELVSRIFSIMQPCPVPEPCDKHPCKFVLPNEKQMTILPVGEVYRQTAQFALDCGAQFLTSESALLCLAELDRAWAIPLAVCAVIGADGDTNNVKVLGSEFAMHRESAQRRTYKAFRHMLQYSLLQLSESSRKCERSNSDANKTLAASAESLSEELDGMDMSSDDEDGSLVIDADDDSQATEPTELELENQQQNHMEVESDKSNDAQTNDEPNTNEKADNSCADNKVSTKDKLTEKRKIGGNEFCYNCTCKDSPFELPSPRSYKKWQLRNAASQDKIDVIVHCSHKVRGESGEVILEPIPEYQLDMGATKQSEHKVKSLALSLLLRRNASLLNVRVDSMNGEVVTLDQIYQEEWNRTHGDLVPEIANAIYTALDQLSGLLPGNYVLQHEPSHGANALLYATRITGGAERLTLQFDGEQLAEADEANSLKAPPALAPTLLPVHKFRKILPLAFTPHAQLVAKESRKPAARQRTPPQAIKLDADGCGARRKWPKRRQRKKKNSQ